jgi:type I restriction enzyme S subunit
MSAVSEISKAIVNEQSRTYGEVKKGYTPIKHGDLIVAKITPCYENGKQAIANVSSQFAYGSTEFHTFRSSNKDLVTLLHYYLQTKNVMREGAANMKGAAGQRRVPDSFFKSLPFALPATNDLNKFGAAIASQNKRRAEQIRQLAVIENTNQSLQHQAFTTGFAA